MMLVNTFFYAIGLYYLATLYGKEVKWSVPQLPDCVMEESHVHFESW